MPATARSSSTPSLRSRGVNALLAMTLCVTAACVLQQATVLFAADWSSSSARHRLSKWTASPENVEDHEWAEVQQDLEDALALTPKDATLLDAMAQLHSLKGQSLWTTGEQDSPEIVAYKQALQYQLDSLQVRPTHAMAWANLALIQYAVNAQPQELLRSWGEAARLGPKERDVENTLVFVAKETWALQPANNRAWVEARRPGFGATMEKRQAG